MPCITTCAYVEVLCADQQSLEEPLATDAVEKYLPTARTSKQEEEYKTQDLTRFGKFAYVLRARKREFFIDSIINTNIMHTYEEDSAPLFIAKETRRIGNLNWTRFQFRTEIRNLKGSVCRSTGRWTNPSPGRLCRSTAPTREENHVSRSTRRSIAISCACWCTPVDRSVDRYLLLSVIFFFVLATLSSFTTSLFLQEVLHIFNVGENKPA